jgi:hypothetical protein
VDSSAASAQWPSRVLIVAVGPDGKARPLTDITDRVTTAAALLTAGTCYARNRPEGRAAIHLAMPGAERALCRVLQGEPAGDPQPTCAECQARSWAGVMLTVAGAQFAQAAYDALAAVFPAGSPQRADLDAGLRWWQAWRQRWEASQQPGNSGHA